MAQVLISNADIGSQPNVFSFPRIRYIVQKGLAHMTSTNPNNDQEVWLPESALDILLALLYSEGANCKIGEGIEGITRLDKIMFLLSESEEFKDIINKGYTFEADNFGPFAPELFDDIEALKQENIIMIVSERTPKRQIETADETSVIDPTEDDDPSDVDFSVRKYQLSNEGMGVSKLIYNGLNEDQKNKLSNIKKTWQDRDLSDLLHYVYTKYPKTTEKSKIRDQVLNKG